MSAPESLAYEDWVAELYDTLFSDWLDSTGMVGRLTELAGAGPVLELGVGTGRVALPLSRAGVEVHGIDASEAMVARLLAKPGGDRVAVTIGDFTDFSLDGHFSLIYAAAGTFFELQYQEAQVRCFQAAARHLAPGGRFVVDGLVPDASRAGDQPAMNVISSKPGQLVIRLRQVDRAEQRYVSHYVVLSDSGLRLLSVPFRFAWPSELDLMGTMAGLRLRERTAGWQGERFTATSESHVSIYERPA